MSENKETDTFAYQQSFITITPLKFDWTSYDSLEKIQNWDLKAGAVTYFFKKREIPNPKLR